ncbi:hypothetical protein HK101_009137 [Irineochytrium annulatum]|nr:hypothetical protein HK101_009137 [Irineochytrium annulatum]
MAQRPPLVTAMFSSLRGHKTFMVAACSFEHVHVPMSLMHYGTWSFVLTGLYSVVTYFNPTAALLLAVLLAGWSITLDPYVGAFYTTLTAAYVHIAHVLVSEWGLTPLGAVAMMGGAIAFEGLLHIIFQGPIPGPPPETKIPLYVAVPYFVLTMGIFFLTLTFAMRFGGYEKEAWADAKWQTSEWHRMAAAETKVERHRKYHLEVLKKGL